jgi:Tol biopolymer transport system component
MTRDNGMVHFASAGNNASASCSYPASLPTVNACAALNRWGNLASFSNYGSCITFSAPGAWIFTTDRTGADGGTTADYGYASGTSFASPYSAGVAALILSQNPGLDAASVEFKMMTTAMDLGDPGKDDVFGWGFVNASAALSGSDAETCGAGAGDCLSAHGGLGCDDAACCTYVCLADPGCCEIAWDQSCADTAETACNLTFSGSTTRVSVDSGGTEGNSDSYWPRIAEDAPHISAFDGYSDNLVPDDTNGVSDVFVHDTDTGQTERVSVASGGGQGNGNSWLCELSADGRHVLFHSVANNLAAGGDTNSNWDVFVHDRDTDTTARVSVSSDGAEANSLSLFGSVTPDGRYVAFFSDASNLVADDTNIVTDTFVIDRDVDGNGVFDEAGGIETTRVSVSSAGDQGNGASGDYNGVCPQISPDGRYVVFPSLASNLVLSDTNGTWDTFVHDRQSGETHRMSISSAGVGADGWSRLGDISANGRFVIFSSTATNLVAGDTNGMHDVFVHDRDADEDGIFDEPGEVETTRVSVASDGSESNGIDGVTVISSNGRYVAFNSTASNLGVDFNYRLDVYVHDRATGKTRLASAGTDGIGDGNSFWPAISARGQYVAFHSYSDNLVPDDSGAFRDVFVRDLGVLCPWDLDDSGSVGTADLLDLLSQWGTDPGGPPDFDGDGNVGTSDLLDLLSNWGECT